MTISRHVYGALMLAIGCAAPASMHAEEWKIAQPGYAWSFPEDHWAHDGYATEWWYLTGHLTPDGKTTPRFGYQFTIFKVGIAPDPPALASDWAAHALVMGHASISDLDARYHVFSDVLHRASPLLGGFGAFPDSMIAWCRAPAGTDASWTLRWNGEAFDFAMADAARDLAFTLSTRPQKPLAFQGPGGYSRKGDEPSQASLYYSFTRLATSGTVRLGGETFSVSGLSWMDKEIGSNQLGAGQVGWDWFSLQLDDGSELMLYELRDATGAVDFARGTRIPARGEPRYLERGEWRVRVTDHWTSPRTAARYPAGWVIEVPEASLVLTVVPELEGQENVSDRSSGIAYWEGAVIVRRDDATFGRGYVELTGYGGRNRPRL